jgi:hypothetical protein
MAMLQVDLSKCTPSEPSQSLAQQKEAEDLKLLLMQVQISVSQTLASTAALDQFLQRTQLATLPEVSVERPSQPESLVTSESEVDFDTHSNDNRTTVMMRNIPNNLVLYELLKLFNDYGFHKFYDFVYLPIDLKRQCNYGYAFINFVDHRAAIAFFRCFTDFCAWERKSSRKVCAVSWGKMQGLHVLVERYRNSAIMHESVPAEGKPVLLKYGIMVPFPQPTKAISAPQQGSRAGCNSQVSAASDSKS